MARRTKDEAEQTRNTILDAAEDVFCARGVGRASLEEVAQKAGVTRGAVYWHFRDKIELCEALMQRVFLPQEDVLEKLAASESDTPLEDLEKACANALKLMTQDPHRRQVATIFTHRCEYVKEMTAIMERRWQCKDRMLDRSKRLFERAQKLKQLSPVWPPRIASRTLQGLMTGLITNAIEREKQFNLATEGATCIHAFFKSVRK